MLVPCRPYHPFSLYWFLVYGLFLVLLTATSCGNRPSDSPGHPFVETVPSEEAAARPLPADAAPPERQVLRYFSNEPSSLDVSVALYESLGSAFLFERLCMVDENGELIPGAADRWERSPDGRTWTFHLHPGARWSDGTPVTALDFEYTYKRLLHPDSGNVYAFFYYDIKGARAYNQREADDPDLLGVRAIDDLTFEIETEEPCAYLPYVTSYTASSPVPRWQVEKYGARWTEAGRCVSNSAFRLDKWEQGKYMTFRLNPHYKGNNPGHLRKIVRLFSGTAGTGSASGGVGLLPYENDEVDLVGVGSPADLDRIRSDSRLSEQLWKFNGVSTVYLFFRTREPPLNDVRVRQAIARAIDKQTIADVLFKGAVRPAYGMRPPNFPGYAGEKLRHLQQFDPETARRLLADAGYPGGRGFPVLEVWLRDAPPSSQSGQAVQMIQEQLLDILGIRLEIRNMQANAFNRLMYEWEIPMGMVSYGADFSDPQSLLGVPWRSQPRGFTRHDWNNARYNDLIDRARRETERDRRMQLYEEAEWILTSEVGGAFLWHNHRFQLRKPWIKGLKRDRAGFYPFWENNTVYTEMYIGRARLDG
ncbi:MAG: peptide ABC transporter substrate-binding protein [Gemmatimonadetes bacterium]|nr:peptide ABC transporter substrate-binding protein [Gemmatimonadota bacterium]MYG17730.1 peptide ABC transporter substrate-binding protein [Gemmatimonadota bacterium]